jgi:hypothetical protein
MIARALLSVVLGCSLGCSLPWRVPELKSAPETPRQGTRFAILPMNAVVPIPPELAESTSRVMGQVTHYLAVQGYDRYWIEESTAQRLWLESVARVDASDSMPHDFDSAIRVFAVTLGESEPFDSLVVASLVYREAILKRGVAKWDGVAQRISKPDDDSKRVPDSYEAGISGVSLHVMIFDPRGELVFENYGGLDLAHSFSLAPGDGGRVRASLRESFLGREHLVKEGVENAFDPYLRRPEPGTW